MAFLVGCASSTPDTATTTVRLDGGPWRVLQAGADGMRGRDGFGAADGMLLDRGAEVDPGSVYFVMDGVAFPLDIAWFDGTGRLVGTAEMPVCPAEPCPRHASPGPFRWAIEAPVGAFAGLAPGARLEVEPS
jgi:uncharacterized membrane protein (UPF0127 family)